VSVVISVAVDLLAGWLAMFVEKASETEVGRLFESCGEV
jgi:hypothetical protein